MVLFDNRGLPIIESKYNNNNIKKVFNKLVDKPLIEFAKKESDFYSFVTKNLAQYLFKNKNYIEEKDCSMLEAERRVLGVGHPRIGGWLVSHWNLPASLEAGITYYRDPFQAEEQYRKLPCLIHVGDVLARTVHHRRRR